MPSELEDGKDVSTPLNRFSGVFTVPVCAWLASVCQTQDVQKIMLNNRKEQNAKNHREIHKSPLLKNALF